ncbi:hypothetical protein HYH03_005484 [Edaphochlamys debaryana]|uniref:Uncharacterized protein n=1 Tax=Edaphochlamys debaryana TaxID=47281 RepID=A0A835Y7Q0_9CHLO|nr:hypothetical protein HYH03_005484 [Edaphochlamys debaryana]|eukprot:KAG2496664.1 hypothetical protein HYH03_005484 [Edaphochlamys debaryana]
MSAAAAGPGSIRDFYALARIGVRLLKERPNAVKASLEAAQARAQAQAQAGSAQAQAQQAAGATEQQLQRDLARRARLGPSGGR